MERWSARTRARLVLSSAFLLLVFPSGARAQTSGLYLYGEVGAHPFAGERTASAADATFYATRNYREGVSVTVTAPGVEPVRLHFAAANNQPLLTGQYHAARSYSFGAMVGLEVEANHSFCGSLTGRFDVLEIVVGPSGEVQRFAADFEHHCSGNVPGLFGAIRFNSTVAALSPFGGQFSGFSVSVDPSPLGRVTGGPIECGAGAAACEASFGATTQLSLSATPEPGYAFAGWKHDCSGPAATTISVVGTMRCSALFEPVTPASPRSLLVWDSQPVSAVGAPEQKVLSPANSVWYASASYGKETLHLSVEGIDQTSNRRWRVSLSPPAGESFVAGRSYHATRFPFADFAAGLDIGADSGGCNQLTGRIVVHDVQYAPDGTLLSIAADLERHCEDAVPAVYVALRYNSTYPGGQPFGGDYPRYRVTVQPAPNGRVTGENLACSASESACQVDRPAPGTYTLTAHPDPGYMFTGWVGGCHGSATTTINVNGPKACSATFERIAAMAPRTLLRWTSTIGTYYRSETYSPINSTWSAQIHPYTSALVVVVTGLGDATESRWQFSFAPPKGETLVAGRKYSTVRSGIGITGATLDVIGEHRGWGTGVGWFLIRELVLDATGAVLRAAVEFEQDGVPTAPPFTGALQYNSLIDRRTLKADRTSLYFAAEIRDGSTFVARTSPQLVRLTHSHGEPVPWTALASDPWLTVTPSSGHSAPTLSVDIRPPSPAWTGSQSGLVRVLSNDGSTDPLEIVVHLSLQPVGSSPPYGAVDTPVQNASGVTGSLPVTGWVLDDIEVRAVRILRDPVAGEGQGLVFVGDATLVEGARPDVAVLYPAHPRSSRAGWGYLMLTNMLPNQGNGTFTLHAYAEDAEGHTVLLGSRVITCTNATATAPFGAIDTPLQGETVTGLVNNFGWVLAPGSTRADVPGGGSVNVVIDGVSAGVPGGWTSRADLTSLFPSGYADLNSALAVHTIDSRLLTDGVHTIAWGVTATNGESAGIGSRYFTVANGSASLTAGVLAPQGQSRVMAGAKSNETVDVDFAAVTVSRDQLLGRRGWGDRPLRPLAHERGKQILHGEEMDRFELALGGGGPYSGYLRVGSALAPLPIGSRLEESTGVVTWMPGVAFIGQYDLVFVRWAAGRAVARHEVRIVLHPKGSNRVGPQVVIDTPSDPVASGLSRKDLAQPFLVAGWAVDLDDSVGTGVAALHVWAYPVTASGWDDPIFLGATAYGGIRPDVAAIYGERFRESGYGLFVDGLAPGTYDLAVFAWSTVRNGFAPAKVVRVTVR